MMAATSPGFTRKSHAFQDGLAVDLGVEIANFEHV